MSTKNQFSSGMERGGAASAERSGGSGSADQLKDKAGDVKQNLQEMGTLARDAAADKLGELRDSATQLRDTATQKAGEVRDMAQQRAGELRDSATEYYEAGRDRAIDFEHSLETRIREKPLNSVMIAAGVGMVVGILWMRR